MRTDAARATLLRILPRAFAVGGGPPAAGPDRHAWNIVSP
jgi:hypothetical protein